LDGNSCGVKSIGVTWGLHDKKELYKGNPIVTIDNSKDLLSAIQNVLNKRIMHHIYHTHGSYCRRAIGRGE